MGEPQTTHVDIGALRAVASRFDDAANLISRAGQVRPVFDGTVSGRAHVAEGSEFRRTLDQLLVDVNLWARASAEVAVALRTGADRYRGADVSAAAGIG